MTIERAQVRLATLQQARHPLCVVCGARNKQGLQLRFRPREDGSVEARFDGRGDWQGYAGLLHGGVIASLLDGAMTNCLFAQGIAAMTGSLSLRYLHPVEAGSLLTLHAWASRHKPPLHAMAAELRQHGRVAVRATARFMEPAAATGESGAGAA